MSKVDNFPYPTPIPAKIWRVPFGVDPSCWVYRVRGKVRLISREIIFQEFQPIWSRYLNVTDGRTDRQTDGQLAMAIPRSAKLRAVKNKAHLFVTCMVQLINLLRWRSQGRMNIIPRKKDTKSNFFLTTDTRLGFSPQSEILAVPLFMRP